MNCKYFGECGSCTIFENGYSAQLESKKNLVSQKFQNLFTDKFDEFKSPEQHYRYRVEFKIWHKADKINYAMRGVEKGQVVLIENCPMASKPIYDLMKPLISEIEPNILLSKKLFSIEFLSSLTGDIIVTLIYHKKLSEIGEAWDIQARKLQEKFNISIIGRSRKEKRVLKNDFIDEVLKVGDSEYKFKYFENSFSQPNPIVNRKMVKWISDNVEKIENRKDLIELYCGSGNFTIPLSTKFQKVLATEISKSGIISAIENRDKNGVTNIDFIRVSSEEFTDAIDKKREFFRLKDIDLDSFSLNTIFIDPPRAGLDEKSIKLVQRFANILYISCNPETFHRDLEILTQTHIIQKMAIFDQFPYTHHLEMGVILISKN